MAREPRTYAVIPDPTSIGGPSLRLPVQMRVLPYSLVGGFNYFRDPALVTQGAYEALVARSGQPARPATLGEVPVSTYVPQSQMFQRHVRLPGGASRGPYMSAGSSIGPSLAAESDAHGRAVLAATQPNTPFVVPMGTMADRLGATAIPPTPPQSNPSLVRLRPTVQRNAGPMTAAQVAGTQTIDARIGPRGRSAQEARGQVQTALNRIKGVFGG